MSKKYDVVAVVGQYTDQSGQQKPKFENVGAVILNSNGGLNLLLKKTFNPAGLAEPDKESIILSLFEPQQKAQQAMQQPPQQAAPTQGYHQPPQQAAPTQGYHQPPQGGYHQMPGK